MRPAETLSGGLREFQRPSAALEGDDEEGSDVPGCVDDHGDPDCHDMSAVAHDAQEEEADGEFEDNLADDVDNCRCYDVLCPSSVRCLNIYSMDGRAIR